MKRRPLASAVAAAIAIPALGMGLNGAASARTSWGPQLASATGTEHVNDCIPYCAAGHFHSYPVNVVLWGSKAAGPGRQRYTKITELYPDVHPPYVRTQPATFSETLYP